MGVGKKAARKRAVGTREHIIGYLGGIGELFDPSGMASTKLAAAVGYPGSSVAFAQLLSGMERSGLIDREVRGKRTYRIGLGQAAAPAHAAMAAEPGWLPALAGDVPAALGTGPAERDAARTGAGHGAADPYAAAQRGASRHGAEHGAAEGAAAAGFDYDELARRLLVRVVRQLAAGESQPASPDPAGLRETVNALEFELATAWTKHGKLAEENVRLREQLSAAQRSLALAAERVRSLPSDLDSREIGLLRRLLTEDAADGLGDEIGVEPAADLGVSG